MGRASTRGRNGPVGSYPQPSHRMPTLLFGYALLTLESITTHISHTPPAPALPKPETLVLTAIQAKATLSALTGRTLTLRGVQRLPLRLDFIVRLEAG